MLSVVADSPVARFKNYRNGDGVSCRRNVSPAKTDGHQMTIDPPPRRQLFRMRQSFPGKSPRGGFPGNTARGIPPELGRASGEFPGKCPGCASTFPGNYRGISRELGCRMRLHGKFTGNLPGGFPEKLASASTPRGIHREIQQPVGFSGKPPV